MKGSERRARKLHPKPEAVAARGAKASPAAIERVVDAAPVVPENHGAGDGARIQGERVERAARALSLIEYSSRMLLDARDELRMVAGTQHHAHKQADAAVHAASVAMASARNVLRAVRR